jgi:acetyl esterase/lipase
MNASRTRTLTTITCLLALVMIGLAVCEFFPVPWNGPGLLGACALFYPLHLLLFTLLAVIPWWKAIRRRAPLAAWVSAFTVVLTICMALVPTALIWKQAEEYHVPLSVREYLANAAHANAGLVQEKRSVVYGHAKDGTDLKLDVWTFPVVGTDGGPYPAIVMVHGGGWISGHRSITPDWNRWLNSVGYVVFDVEYRMPPPARWLEEVGDVKAALGWVSQHSSDYSIDPQRITLMGNSAGANLVLLAAYSRGDARLPPSTDVPEIAVRSVINIYGPTDLTLIYNDCPSRAYLRELLIKYIGGTPAEYPDRYRLLSPLTHVNAQAPPTLTVTGTWDRVVPVNQSMLLNEALRKAGVQHELCVLPGNDHAFDSNWGGFGTQVARAKIKAFLKSH